MLVTLGHDYAEHLEAYELLDETEKSALADIKLRFQGMSDAAATTAAQATPEYRERVEQKVKLKKAMLRARVKYESAKKAADLFQTQQANLRVEYKAAGRM